MNSRDFLTGLCSTKGEEQNDHRSKYYLLKWILAVRIRCMGRDWINFVKIVIRIK